MTRDASRPLPDRADPAWLALLELAPPEVRETVKRLEERVDELEAELARLRTAGFPAPRTIPPASPEAPRPPAAELQALCRRFRIARVKTFGKGREENPEDETFLVFVELEPGVDQDSIDTWELESRLGDLFQRAVTLRFL